MLSATGAVHQTAAHSRRTRIHHVRYIVAIALCSALGCIAAKPAVAATLMVNIDGVSGDLLTNVRDHLSLWRERKSPELDARRIQRLHARAPQQIDAALRAFGYFQAQVTGELVATGTNWQASYRIEPGAKVALRQVDIQLDGPGHEDETLARLVDESGLTPGAPLDQPAYDAFKSRLLASAVNQGYPDANFTEHDIDVFPDDYHADIRLHLFTGELHRFGALTFDQQGELHYDADLLQRFVKIQPGEPYRPQRMVALRSALLDSQYFSDVVIEPRRGEIATVSEIPITIETTADRSGKYRFGVGYGTDTGARVSTAHSQVVNSAGHQLVAEAKLAQKDQSALIEYLVPLTDPLTDNLSFTLRADQLDTDSRESSLLIAGVARTGVRAGWTETLGIRAEQEDFRVGGESGRTTLVLPYGSWNRSRANDRLFPTRGWRIGFDVLTSLESLGSDIHFLQGRVAGKYIAPLGDAGRLLLRGQAGTTLTDGFDKMPPSKRFFAGGDQSVRGYQFEELGPTNAQGRVEGGRHLLVGSLELEHHIAGRWSGAAFVDAGNAINRVGDPLRTGVGIGVRARTPIGPIRVDLARGLDNPDANFLIHISLGPDL
ncbi:MAG: outer membrane protein assembly factor [Gammaproteobacteria bacterium]|nr:outer membrane protein assembly factor [Gammaproteobacteria bacterium]